MLSSEAERKFDRQIRTIGASVQAWIQERVLRFQQCPAVLQYARGEVLKNASLLGFKVDSNDVKDDQGSTSVIILEGPASSSAVEISFDLAEQLITYRCDSVEVFKFSLTYLNEHVKFCNDILKQLMVGNIILQHLLRLVASGRIQ